MGPPPSLPSMIQPLMPPMVPPPNMPPPSMPPPSMPPPSISPMVPPPPSGESLQLQKELHNANCEISRLRNELLQYHAQSSELQYIEKQKNEAILDQAKMKGEVMVRISVHFDIRNLSYSGIIFPFVLIICNTHNYY